MKKLILTLIIGIILAISIPVSVMADEPVDGYYHYIGPWVWDAEEMGGLWEAPANTISCIDLRSNTECGQRGGVPGIGYFICDSPIADTAYRDIGRFFSDEFAVKVRTFLQNRYGITIEAYTARGLIWELFAEEGDITGLLRWKPLIPDSQGIITIHLAGFSPVDFWKDPPKNQCNWNWRHKWPSPWGWHWGWNKWGKWGYWNFR